jgi:hypothetical protein
MEALNIQVIPVRRMAVGIRQRAFMFDLSLATNLPLDRDRVEWKVFGSAKGNCSAAKMQVCR